MSGHPISHQHETNQSHHFDSLLAAAMSKMAAHGENKTLFPGSTPNLPTSSPSGAVPSSPQDMSMNPFALPPSLRAIFAAMSSAVTAGRPSLPPRIGVPPFVPPGGQQPQPTSAGTHFPSFPPLPAGHPLNLRHHAPLSSHQQQQQSTHSEPCSNPQQQPQQTSPSQSTFPPPEWALSMMMMEHHQKQLQQQQQQQHQNMLLQAHQQQQRAANTKQSPTTPRPPVPSAPNSKDKDNATSPSNTSTAQPEEDQLISQLLSSFTRHPKANSGAVSAKTLGNKQSGEKSESSNSVTESTKSRPPTTAQQASFAAGESSQARSSLQSFEMEQLLLSRPTPTINSDLHLSSLQQSIPLVLVPEREVYIRDVCSPPMDEDPGQPGNVPLTDQEKVMELRLKHMLHMSFKQHHEPQEYHKIREANFTANMLGRQKCEMKQLQQERQQDSVTMNNNNNVEKMAAGTGSLASGDEAFSSSSHSGGEDDAEKGQAQPQDSPSQNSAKEDEPNSIVVTADTEDTETEPTPVDDKSSSTHTKQQQQQDEEENNNTNASGNRDNRAVLAVDDGMMGWQIIKSTREFPVDPKGYYYCHLCLFKTYFADKYQSHILAHHPHKCPHCDFYARNKVRLESHLSDKHDIRPPGRPVPKRRGVRCSYCKNVFSTKEEMWDHLPQDIRQDKLFECYLCNFKTELKHHAEYHFRCHFNSKPFQCLECKDYRCVNQSMLNSHMRSHGAKAAAAAGVNNLPPFNLPIRTHFGRDASGGPGEGGLMEGDHRKEQQFTFESASPGLEGVRPQGAQNLTSASSQQSHQSRKRNRTAQQTNHNQLNELGTMFDQRGLLNPSTSATEFQNALLWSHLRNPQQPPSGLPLLPNFFLRPPLPPVSISGNSGIPYRVPFPTSVGTPSTPLSTASSSTNPAARFPHHFPLLPFSATGLPPPPAFPGAFHPSSLAPFLKQQQPQTRPTKIEPSTSALKQQAAQAALTRSLLENFMSTEMSSLLRSMAASAGLPDNAVAQSGLSKSPSTLTPNSVTEEKELKMEDEAIDLSCSVKNQDTSGNYKQNGFFHQDAGGTTSTIFSSSTSSPEHQSTFIGTANNSLYEPAGPRSSSTPQLFDEHSNKKEHPTNSTAAGENNNVLALHKDFSLMETPVRKRPRKTKPSSLRKNHNSNLNHPSYFSSALSYPLSMEVMDSSLNERQPSSGEQTDQTAGGQSSSKSPPRLEELSDMFTSPHSGSASTSNASSTSNGTTGAFCVHCLMAFPHPDLLNFHQQFHGLEDPFRCRICHTQCRNGVEFTQHLHTAFHDPQLLHPQQHQQQQHLPSAQTAESSS